MIRYGVLLLVLAAIAAMSCRAKKMPDAPVHFPDESHGVWNLMQENTLPWNSAVIRSRLQYRDESGTQSGTVNIRMIKDSVVWMNATKLGFEIARVLVTADSAFVLNRLEGSTSAVSLYELAHEFGLPPRLDYIQHLLMGQTIPAHYAKASNDSSNPLRFKVRDSRLMWHYLLMPDTGMPSLLAVEDEGSAYKLVWNLSNYRVLPDTRYFSFLREGIVLDEKDQTILTIQLDISHVDVDTTFDIPFRRP